VAPVSWEHVEQLHSKAGTVQSELLQALRPTFSQTCGNIRSSYKPKSFKANSKDNKWHYNPNWSSLCCRVEL